LFATVANDVVSANGVSKLNCGGKGQPVCPPTNALGR